MSNGFHTRQLKGGQKTNYTFCHKAKGMCEYEAKEDLNERCQGSFKTKTQAHAIGGEEETRWEARGTTYKKNIESLIVAFGDTPCFAMKITHV
jgi:hypothetical protein